MGNLCHGKADSSINSFGQNFFNKETGAEYIEDSDADEDEIAAEKGDVYVVICGSNYDSPACQQAGWGPIDQYKSAEFIKRLVALCPNTIPEENVRYCMGNDMTRPNVQAAIEEMAGNCTSDNDTLFLYYAGHGEQMEDQDGDEAHDTDAEVYTGKDQAMCTLNPQTFCPEPRDDSTWFRDDHIVEAIVNNAASGCKVIACLDCCHSGGMLDLEHPSWKSKGFRALSISGCASAQVSKGLGRGSFFSHSLSGAYEVLQQSYLQNGGSEDDLGDMTITAASMYNQIVAQFNQRYDDKSEQEITIRYIGMKPDHMPWPIVPEATIGGEGSSGKALVYAAPTA